MTHNTPPKRIWADPPETFDGMDVWRSEPGGKGIPYILASEAEAMVAAALREAHDAIADYPRSSPEEAEWSRYDEQIEYSQRIIETLIPQPASAALDKLIAEAVNEAMLQCTGIVANLRNKRNPGPLFEVLNRAMSDIEDARFAAIREKNNG